MKLPKTTWEWVKEWYFRQSTSQRLLSYERKKPAPIRRITAILFFFFDSLWPTSLSDCDVLSDLQVLTNWGSFSHRSTSTNATLFTLFSLCFSVFSTCFFLFNSLLLVFCFFAVQGSSLLSSLSNYGCGIVESFHQDQISMPSPRAPLHPPKKFSRKRKCPFSSICKIASFFLYFLGKLEFVNSEAFFWI